MPAPKHLGICSVEVELQVGGILETYRLGAEYGLSAEELVPASDRAAELIEEFLRTVAADPYSPHRFTAQALVMLFDGPKETVP